MTAGTLDLRELPARTAAVTTPRPRWPRVRRPGAVLAAAFVLALATQPALLPHLWWVQSITAGLAAAQAYGLTALLTPMRDGVRRLLERRTSRRAAASRWGVGARWFGARGVGARGFGRWGVGGKGGGGFAVAVSVLVTAAGGVVGYPGQLAVAARTDMAGPRLLDQVLAVAGAALVAVAVVRLGRGTRRLARAARRRPRRAAAVALAPALVLATAAFAPALTTPAGPAAVGSTAPGNISLGAEVGKKGQEFLTAPNPAGATRVYVGERAGDPGARARLAVQELDRVGGFDRGTVLVDVPTGSGWVNPKAVRSLEKLTNGDVATVTVQYASSPSWWSYLKGGEGVQQSVRELVDAIDEHAENRDTSPRVLIYGESLGAWGGLRAYPKGDDVTNHVDGALWAGVPGGVEKETERQVGVIHADDPVPAWSPGLMVHSSPEWPRRWLPVASFWQATADVISATATPQGFGHRYGDEVTGAWADLLRATPTYDSPL